MKKLFYLMLFLITFACITSCSKDDDEESVNSYTKEQLATLTIMHGSFSNDYSSISGKTTFVFSETFLNGSKSITATNYYDEKSEREIHGYLTYHYDFPDGSFSEHPRAFYLAPNGTDLTLYHIKNDKTISLGSTELYKIVVQNENRIRLIDMDFPYSSGQIFNRNN